MELEDTEILTQKSVTGSSDTALERIVNQTITDTSILPPFISKLDVNTGLSGISAIPFVDTVGADDANFTVGSTKVSKSKDFTTAEVTTETIEDAVTEVGIDSTIQNILDIQTVKKIEASILEALNSDTRIRYSMNPSWAGIHEGILELGSDIYSIVGTIYVAVSLPVYLNLIENEDENLVKLLGSKLKLVIMEGFTNSQLLIVHEYGVAGGIGVKNIEKERKPGLDRVDYTAPYTHSFGWDPRFIRFSGALYSRYFRRNEGTTDYATIPEVTLAGDQRWEFDILTSETNTRVFVSGSEAGDRWYLGIQNGKLLIGNGTDRVIGSDTIGDGFFHSITWELSGGIVTAKVDGVVQYSNTLKATLPYSISNLMASEAGGTISSGILANLKIYDNGTLIRDYPLDEPKGTDIIVNRATELGENLWTYGDAVDYDLGGAYRLISGVNSGPPVAAGVTYLVSAYLDTNGDTYFETGSTTGAARATFPPTTGWVTFTVSTPDPTTNSSMRWNTSGASGGPFTGSITNMSIRRADGYGTIINGNDEDKGLFTKQANGDWLGEELSVIDTFNSVPIGGDSVTRYTVTPVDTGLSYRLSVGVENYLGSRDIGFIGTSVGTNIPSSNRVSSNENISIDISVDTTSTAQLFSRDTNQCTFRSPSVKEVLKSA